MTPILEWFRNYEVLIWWTGAASVLMFLGSLCTIPIILIKIPADYFSSLETNSRINIRDLSFFRLLYLIFKNTVGIAFILAGLIMLLLPGQGILTIIVGMCLLDFPGKYRLVRNIIRNKTILVTINKLRSKADKPPIEVPR
ncbi:MAG TPA: hypothetical protein HPQ03_11370 [Deltaproteobacteria bacterium]|nr:hypothetical protein [Deltaproteobacteria bacterium]